MVPRAASDNRTSISCKRVSIRRVPASSCDLDRTPASNCSASWSRRVRNSVASSCNLVWAIERTVPLPTSGVAPGARPRTSTTSTCSGSPACYRVMTEVPEQWIPFIAVHTDGSTRETQLQRAALHLVRSAQGDRARWGSSGLAFDQLIRPPSG